MAKSRKSKKSIVQKKHRTRAIAQKKSRAGINPAEAPKTVHKPLDVNKVLNGGVDLDAQMRSTSMFAAPIAICVLEGPEHVFTFSNPLFELLERVFRTSDHFIGEESSVPNLDSNGNICERCINFSFHSFRDSQGPINVRETRVKNG